MSRVNESVVSCSSLFKHSIYCINSELCTLGIAAAGAIGKSIGATEASAKPEEEEKCVLNSCQNLGGTLGLITSRCFAKLVHATRPKIFYRQKSILMVHRNNCPSPWRFS